jgi:hypothetical protein
MSVRYAMFAMALMLPAAAEAATIRWNFTGTVFQVTNRPGISVGDTLTGFVVFEARADSATWSSTLGSYQQGPASELFMQVGSLSSSRDLQRIDVESDRDGFFMIGTAASLEQFDLWFIDPTRAVFSSDALPLAPPNFPLLARWEQFNSNRIGIAQGFGATLTSVTLDGAALAVPEPASLGLFALGGAALALVGRRRRAPRDAQPAAG